MACGSLTVAEVHSTTADAACGCRSLLVVTAGFLFLIAEVRVLLLRGFKNTHRVYSDLQTINQ